MSISRIKQIKRILRDHPVTDPRGAVQAITDVMDQPQPEKPKVLLQVTAVKSGPNTMTVTLKFDRKNLKPCHVVKTMDALNEFSGGECNDPACPVYGNAATSTLGELLEQFEAEAEAKKNGGVQ